jgi:hypothetical protein
MYAAVPPGCSSDVGDGDRLTHAGRDRTRAMPKSHTYRLDPLLCQLASIFSLDSEVRDASWLTGCTRSMSYVETPTAMTYLGTAMTVQEHVLRL